MKLKEIYFSHDIESVGPIPGEYSMSSMGVFAAGGRTHDGEFVDFSRHDTKNLFYKELKPISDIWVPEAIKVGLLDGFDTAQEDEDGALRFEWMKEHGEDPTTAMTAFNEWVKTLAKSYDARPVFVAYPAGFDWMFVYWYLQKFIGESPFGFSGVIDLKTYYLAKANVPLAKSTKRYMPKALLKSDAPHSHHALDDAIGQGHLAMNLFKTYN